MATWRHCEASCQIVSSSSLLRLIGAIGHFSPHENNTKGTRSCPVVLGRQHDYVKPLTMALRRAKWTREFNTKMNLRKVYRQFFGMPKFLPPLTKLLPEPEILNRRSYHGLRCPHEWPDVFTIRSEFEHFLYHVSIWCPSVNFGTVWRGH